VEIPSTPFEKLFTNKNKVCRQILACTPGKTNY